MVWGSNYGGGGGDYITHHVRPAPQHTQPSMQCVLRLFWGVKRSGRIVVNANSLLR